MNDRHVTQHQVDAIAEVNRLRPTESQFIGKKGYQRKYREDGSYSWRFRYKQNDHGKLTKEAHEVIETFRPFMKADTARVLSNQAKLEKASFRDKEGNVQFVDAALAEKTARRTGWSHRWRAGGASVESGADGMLFRRGPEDWEPLGVRCLGIPLKGRQVVSRRGLQHDPDGQPWRFAAGEWRKLG